MQVMNPLKVFKTIFTFIIINMKKRILYLIVNKNNNNRKVN